MFYVYELVDPRDGKAFYVGKGKGNRKSCHAKEAKRGAVGRKSDRIREIWTAGLQVRETVVREFSKEAEAYEFERARIAEYGLLALTNLTPGGGRSSKEWTPSQADRRAARRLIPSLVLGLRKFVKYPYLYFRFCGTDIHLERKLAQEILQKGVSIVVKMLGENETRAEFLRYKVSFDN